MTESTWQTSQTDGILYVTIGTPGRSVTAFSSAVLDELDGLLDRIEKEKGLKGVIFKSGKPGSFIVGADIEEMKSIAGPEAARTQSRKGQRIFARLERLKVPTVALISGACVGGGLEFVLCCKYRIAEADRKTSLGLPEVMIGLVPGWGGTVRLPRQVGLVKGVGMITAGESLSAWQAKSCGLVDDAVPPEAMDAAALTILDKPPKKRKQTWAQWAAETGPGRSFILNKAEKMALAKTRGHYPAPIKAINVLRKGMLESADAGFEAESSAISELAASPVTRETIRIFFLREEAKKWAAEVCPDSDTKIRSAAVLGAGKMGAGLARLMADRGIDVRLKDVSPELLSEGLKTCAQLFNSSAKRKKITQKMAEDGMRRVSPTLDYSGFRRLDLVLEAVVEKMEVKHAVFKDLEANCGPETIFATNTSSLRVSEIAKAVKQPERVVGLHFFNPPHQMPLVEVIRTPSTSKEALAAALALAKQLGKTPVVVADCAGFLVNRLLAFPMNEIGYLLAEVDDPMELEKAAVEFGFPMGLLKLTDLVGVDVSTKVSEHLLAAYGERLAPAPAWQKLAELRQKSKTAPKLIIKKAINPELLPVIQRLRASNNSASGSITRAEIAKRLVYPLINEAARCLAEKVVQYPEQIDLAMIFGTGFAPFRGGPMHYANSVGLPAIVETLKRWSEQHPRMTPSDALVDFAKSGKFPEVMPIS